MSRAAVFTSTELNSSEKELDKLLDIHISSVWLKKERSTYPVVLIAAAHQTQGGGGGAERRGSDEGRRGHKKSDHFFPYRAVGKKGISICYSLPKSSQHKNM